MDNVSIILSMCIGNMVAWFLAIYTPRGAYHLLANVVVGSIGAALCGFAIARIAPGLGGGGFLAAAPLCALLMIFALHTARNRP